MKAMKKQCIYRFFPHCSLWKIVFLFAVLLFSNQSCSQSSHQSGNSDCKYIGDGYGPDGTIDIKAETVVTGLEVPWALAFLPNGDMLVTERPGRLRLVKNYREEAKLVKEPVATLSTASTSEGGLLGIALHPDFSKNRLFYMYLTTSEGNSARNRVEQWRLSAEGTSAEQIKIVYDNIDAARNHNGGRIAFGPDGMLYVGTGDASDPGKSQNPDSPNGKLLRLTPDGGIPDDNPRPGNPLYLSGIRNTQGWAWPDSNDPTTIWMTDHGPSGERLRFGHDEVSVVKPGDNLGWPTIYRCETQAGLITPVITWNDAVPPGGAAVYTGDAIPEWNGSLLIGTLRSRHLQRVVIENGTVSLNEVYFRDQFGRLREVIMSPDGDLYITTSNCDGRGNCPNEQDKIIRITR
jgi:aldose sugar dehydrogenase